MTHPVPSMLRGWNRENLGNLGALLGLEGVPTPEVVENRFKWLYHSRARAGAESAIRKVWERFKPRPQVVETESLRTAPSYPDLLRGACEFVKASEKDATIEELELFLSHAVTITALQRMKPRERLQFFHQQIELPGLASKAEFEGADWRGPVTTFAALGAAQASGFGVYLAASTALGFLTHAVGVTLPFAVYTGLSSTIAFVIGPVGWLSAGVWGAWKLTEPEWKRIIPGLIYMIAVNARSRLDGST